MKQLPPDTVFSEDVPQHDAAAAADMDVLLINIDGYEGPLDILLELARRQKVDLAKLSILQLVRQYLNFIAQAKELRLDLAADYLVMAAWLAYLKSRLLLPKQAQEEEDSLTAGQMAAALQFQLQRLEAVQTAARDMSTRPQLGQQIFARRADADDHAAGMVTQVTHTATLYDMLAAYGDIQQRQQVQTYELPVFHLMSMDDAMQRLCAMLGALPQSGKQQVWTTLNSLLPQEEESALYRCSSMASLFTAGLELVKQGSLDLRQAVAFDPIYMRATAQFQERSVS